MEWHWLIMFLQQQTEIKEEVLEAFLPYIVLPYAGTKSD